MKTYNFLSGLPRSGSTVLGSILNQNPLIYVTPTSPLLDLLYLNEQAWRSNPSVIANKFDQQIVNMSSAIINSTWEHIDAPFIIDKHRAWMRNIPIIRQIITPDPKVIVTARDIPSVIASFLQLIHKSPKQNFVDNVLYQRNLPITDANRCDLLLNEYISDPWDSFKTGFTYNKQYIHIVEYDDLTINPHSTLDTLYNFLELPKFSHTLSNIINQTNDDDLSAWGLNGLHEIRSVLKKTTKSPIEILGSSLYTKYLNMNLEFWR